MDSQTCVIIGASHAGVNLAFNLRNAGWVGEIILFDTDPELPYHRPPLSKAYLFSEGSLDRVNNAKAYVLGTRFIKSGQTIDRSKLADPTINLKHIAG